MQESSDSSHTLGNGVRGEGGGEQGKGSSWGEECGSWQGSGIGELRLAQPHCCFPSKLWRSKSNFRIYFKGRIQKTGLLLLIDETHKSSPNINICEITTVYITERLMVVAIRNFKQWQIIYNIWFVVIKLSILVELAITFWCMFCFGFSMAAKKITQTFDLSSLHKWGFTG